MVKEEPKVNTSYSTTSVITKEEMESITSSSQTYERRRHAVSSTDSEDDRPIKRQKQKSSSSTDFDNNTSSEDFTKSASKWKSRHLEALHVFYAETPISPAEILEKLKPCFSDRPRKVTCVTKLFNSLLKEKLTFSVDINPFVQCLTQMKCNCSIISSPIADYQTIKKAKAELEKIRTFEKDLEKSFMKDYTKIFSSPDMPDMFQKFDIPAEDLDFVKLIFSLWTTRVRDFVDDTKRVLETYYNPPTEQRLKGQVPAEPVFTSLVRLFTQMHLLKPERGARKRSLKVRGHIVGVVPDIQYLVRDVDEGHGRRKVVQIIEVKCASCKTPSEKTGIHVILNRDVLDQIGLELVSERMTSYFNPLVFGIVCMRTEIIFMILDMSTEHYFNIADEEIDDKYSSSIYYSQPFDILRESERNQISDLLFLVGSQQLV